MKHIIRLLTMVFICAVWLSSCGDGQSQGKFISSDSSAIYTFDGHKLYVDSKASGCPLMEYELREVGKGKFEAKSTIHDPYHEEDSVSNEAISIRKLHYSAFHDVLYEISIGDKYKDTIKSYKAYASGNGKNHANIFLMEQMIRDSQSSNRTKPYSHMNHFHHYYHHYHH